jgi:hypothetical protein
MMEPKEVEETVREMQRAVDQGTPQDVLQRRFNKLSSKSPALFEKASKPMTPADLQHMEAMLRNWRDMISKNRDRDATTESIREEFYLLDKPDISQEEKQSLRDSIAARQSSS